MKGEVLQMLSPHGLKKSEGERPSVPPRRAGKIGSGREASKIAKLTKREREIIALVGEGLKNAEIAERLFISRTTVRHHLTSVFTKLDVPDRLKLIVYAYRHGLARLPE